jgi:twitching motility protein PilT
MHRFPLYPGTGRRPEDTGAGAGATVNFPFPAGTNGDAYLAAVDEVVAPLAAAGVRWLLVSAGFELHRADPLTGLGLAAGDFADPPGHGAGPGRSQVARRLSRWSSSGCARAPGRRGRSVLDLSELLRFLVEQRGSDLHLKVGSPPFVRIDGHLRPAPFDPVGPADTERMAFAIMPKERADEFLARCEADFAHSLAGVGRFRVNVFRQRGSVGLVFRRVLPGTPSFEALGLPPVVRRLAEEPRGLVLVTGPTGAGKTTTIAAMIDHINETKAVNIVTIEDPIEVLHQDKKAIVNQRELGTDTLDYGQAMKRVLRQDPDVIFIGEMRDPETVWAALAAAETGHLVLSTLHTTNATETVNRIVDFFPPYQQKQIRLTLASSLRGVVSQRLLERADGKGRVPAIEVLVMTGRIFDRVIDPAHGEETIEEILADGEYYGMQTFDQSLFNLYKNGLVSLRDAVAVASHPHDFRVAVQQAGLATAF